MNKNKLNSFCRANWPLLILCLPLLINPFGSINPAESGKILGIMFFASLMACMVIYKLFVSKTSQKKFSLNWLFILSGILCLSAIYTFFSISFSNAFLGSFEKFQGLFSNVIYAFIFTGFYFWFKDKPDRFNQVKYVLIVVGTLLASIGLGQLFIPIDLSTNADLFAGRIYATLANPVDLGQTLIFTIIPSLILLSEYWNKSKWARSALISSLTLQLIALYFSANRASLLAIMLVALIILWKSTRQKFWRIITIMFSLCVLLFTMFWLNLDNRSSSTRITLWKGSVEAIQANPWGSGLNSFYQSFAGHVDAKIYQTERFGDVPDHPHNETLNLMIEQGVWSLALYITIFVYIGRGKYAENKNAFWVKSSLLTILISIQFSFLYHSQIMLVIILSAYLAATDTRGKFVTIKPGKFNYILASLMFFLTFQCSVYAASVFRLDSYFNRTIDLIFVDEIRAAETFTQKLTENLPFQTTYHTAFTFLCPNTKLAQINPGLMDGLLEKYRDTFGENFNFWKYSGIWLYTKGENYFAANAFKKSSDAAPGIISINVAWARAAFDAGDFKNAHIQAEKVLTLRQDIVELIANQQNLDKIKLEKLRIFMKSNPQFADMQEIFAKTKNLQ